jgi:hypothetical protein
MKINLAITQRWVYDLSMMNKETVKTVRTIIHHVGSLAAIKFLRSVRGLSFQQAKLAVKDIAACERWTYPQIKADLNWWEQRFEVAL